MTTYILPGFSIKNKEWAEQTKNELSGQTETSVIYWKHWGTGKTESNWIDPEVNDIIQKIKGEQINIIAKSVGTMVAMKLLSKSTESVNKIILCGIPLHDLSDTDKESYLAIKNFPASKLLIIQNEEDNHGSFQEAEKFVNSINADILIKSKPRSDHEYPYFTDFIEFISKK